MVEDGLRMRGCLGGSLEGRGGLLRVRCCVYRGEGVTVVFCGNHGRRGGRGGQGREVRRSRLWKVCRWRDCCSVD